MTPLAAACAMTAAVRLCAGDWIARMKLVRFGADARLLPRPLPTHPERMFLEFGRRPNSTVKPAFCPRVIAKVASQAKDNFPYTECAISAMRDCATADIKNWVAGFSTTFC
jgi:hypothetical protein